MTNPDRLQYLMNDGDDQMWCTLCDGGSWSQSGWAGGHVRERHQIGCKALPKHLWDGVKDWDYSMLGRMALVVKRSADDDCTCGRREGQEVKSAVCTPCIAEGVWRELRPIVNVVAGRLVQQRPKDRGDKK